MFGCLSVTLLQIASSFLFLDGIEPCFGRQFSMCPSTNVLFFDFWFRDHKAQNLLPKICIKSPISRLVWQIERRCLGLPGGFWGWPIQRNHAKCCGADPCCHDNDILARRGDPVAYRLVCLLVGWFVFSLTSRSRGSGVAIDVAAVRQALGQHVREICLGMLYGGQPQPLTRAGVDTGNNCSHRMTPGRAGSQHRSGVAHKTDLLISHTT